MDRGDAAKLLAPIAVAAITAVGTSVRLNVGQVDEDQFVRTTTANCREINELKQQLRDILLNAGADPRFIAESLEKLQTSDCSERVGR